MKAKKIRLYYGIFLSVFTCVLGAVFIALAVTTFAEGGWQAGAFSREIVAQKLFPVSIVFYFWVAAIIAGFALSVAYPYNARAQVKINESVTLKRLSARLPQGEGEGYDASLKKIYVEKRSRIIVYCVGAAVCFAGAIASAVYFFNPENFTQGEAINDSMLKILINVGPWVLASIIGCVGVTLYEKYSLLREITVLKSLIASNKGNPVVKNGKEINPVLLKIKKTVSSKYFIWGIRGAFAALGVAFIVVGALNGGMRDVLYKAINICMECIGLG